MGIHNNARLNTTCLIIDTCSAYAKEIKTGHFLYKYPKPIIVQAINYHARFNERSN